MAEASHATRGARLAATCPMYLPGPSSTERGLPVLRTGSPTVRPAVKAKESVSDRRRRSMLLHGFARKLTGILVALDGGGVSLKLDNLTDELVPADLDQLVHF